MTYHLHTMARTTIDIETPILREIRRLSKERNISMGELVSSLLAEAIARQKGGERGRPFRWATQPMRPLLDLADKEALYAALEEKDT